MNMISILRREISQHGQVVITVEMFNQLQAEWISRVGADDLVAAERENIKALEAKLDTAYEALTAALACADFAGDAEGIVRRGLNNQPQDNKTRLS